MHLKILVGGGCHILGFPIGEELGFVHTAIQRIVGNGITCELKRVNHLLYSKPHSMVAALKDFAPDVVLLQIGNYESLPKMKQWLMRRLHMTSRYTRQSGSGDRNWTPLPDVTLRPSLAWWTKIVTKQVVDNVLGHPFLDEFAERDRLQKFAGLIATHRIPCVILLSPLPCADPTVMQYRRRLGQIFSQVAEFHGFTYVDVMDKLVSLVDERRKFAIYADQIHLNAVGHQLLGAIVEQTITAQLRLPLRRCGEG